MKPVIPNFNLQNMKNSLSTVSKADRKLREMRMVALRMMAGTAAKKQKKKKIRKQTRFRTLSITLNSIFSGYGDENYRDKMTAWPISEESIERATRDFISLIVGEADGWNEKFGNTFESRLKADLPRNLITKIYPYKMGSTVYHENLLVDGSNLPLNPEIDIQHHMEIWIEFSEEISFGELVWHEDMNKEKINKSEIDGLHGVHPQSYPDSGETEEIFEQYIDAAADDEAHSIDSDLSNWSDGFDNLTGGGSEQLAELGDYLLSKGISFSIEDWADLSDCFNWSFTFEKVTIGVIR